jgi:anti-anti-sigma regulatory factor
MTTLIFTLIIIVAEVSFGVYTATRAWNHLPARGFLFYTIGIGLFSLGAVLGPRASDLESGRSTLMLALFGLILLEVGLLVLLSALFVPQWWQGRKPIGWIVLPYVLFGVLLTLDLLAGLGLFFDGLRLVSGSGYIPINREPNATILIIVFLLSWLLPLAILGNAFIHQRNQRPLIGAFALSLVLAVIGGLVFGVVLHNSDLSVLVSIPVLIVLSYAVFNTRLFTPSDAAVGLALGSISEAVAIYDQSGSCLYANPRAQAFGIIEGTQLRALHEATDSDPQTAAFLNSATLDQELQTTLVIQNRRLVCSRTAVRDRRGQLRGAVLLGRDVTELEARSTELEQERARLAATVQELAAEQEQRAALAATVRTLALPVIPVLQGVVIMPLVGDFDLVRSEEFTSVLLQAIEREHAHLALIDITGVPVLDTLGAMSLVRATEAAALLGARCMLVGIRPEIAQALVALGVPLGNLTTAASLQQGLASVLKR